MMGSLRAVWPDQVRIQTRVGAFWPVASVAVGADSAFVSLPRLKGYWAGALSDDETEGDPASLVANLLWLLCPTTLLDDLDGPVLAAADDGWSLRGVLAGSEPPLTLEMRLPKKHAVVRTILIHDGSGRLLLRADRTGRTRVGEAHLPEEVHLSIEEPFARLEVRLLRPRLDPDRPPDLFRISRPPGTHWVHRGELLEMFRAAAEDR
jgi:hypothetical protein